MTVIDDYLDRLESSKREALERVRTLARTIRVPLDSPIPERALKLIIDRRLEQIEAEVFRK